MAWNALFYGWQTNRSQRTMADLPKEVKCQVVKNMVSQGPYAFVSLKNNQPSLIWDDLTSDGLVAGLYQFGQCFGIEFTNVRDGEVARASVRPPQPPASRGDWQMSTDYSGNASHGSCKPRKASSKGNTGGKKASPKKSGSPTRKDPARQY
jgi:hypothetical protein